jgi:predicted branched-subunit amino acid permease
MLCEFELGSAVKWFPKARKRGGVGARSPASPAVVALAGVVAADGAVFGVLAGAAGMGGLAAVAASAVIFSGSAQFALVAVAPEAGAGGGVLAALLLNARYLPMGLDVARSLTGSTGRRLLQSLLLTDESWALARRRDGRLDLAVLLACGGLLWLAWVAGTAVGVLGAGLVADPQRFGLDVAYPVVFLALLWEQLRSSNGRLAALGGAAIAVGLTPWTSPGVPLAAATLAALIGRRCR